MSEGDLGSGECRPTPCSCLPRGRVKTKLNRTEILVQKVFTERYGLELLPIPVSNIPTPDFEVFHEGKLVAALEVKAMADTVETLDVSKPEQMARLDAEPLLGLRNDNGPNRVAKKLHEAVEQLACVEVGKVVVFVNEELVLDRDDLREVLQGFLRFVSETITSLMPDVAQRLAQDRMKADLYAWMEVHGTEAPAVTMWSVTDVGMKLRCGVFGRR